MTEGHPWDEYRKAKLPRGWAYPLGQARIAEALKDAGAAVGFLSLGRPDLPPKSGPLTVFDVVWLGDAAADYFGPVGSGRDRLLMRWTAVPVAARSEVMRQLDDGNPATRLRVGRCGSHTRQCLGSNRAPVLGHLR